jgi:hypothetical protein
MLEAVQWGYEVLRRSPLGFNLRTVYAVTQLDQICVERDEKGIKFVPEGQLISDL